MGYMHIDNLYKNIDILAFKECYAMEKVHGTSARISWKDNQINFTSGGMKHDTFVKIPDFDFLEQRLLEEFDGVNVVVFGEAYGGKMQGMSETYGEEPAFIVFEVRINDYWLNVGDAEDVANKLNLEFVPYNIIPCEIDNINEQRDLPSVVAQRRGCGDDKLREGVVLKPLKEYRNNEGRIIVKHKRDEFVETKTKREINPEKLKILENANEIAKEWVTDMRLNHVLDKLGNPDDISDTKKVISAMIEDILREAKGEIVESQQAKKSIGKLTARKFKQKLSKI